MLEMKNACETCGKALPADKRDAMICSFECTFCGACAMVRHKGKCPNCGGDLQIRPMRAAT